MFSRGGQSQPKHSTVEAGLEQRVDDLEQVVDDLEQVVDALDARIDAIAASLQSSDVEPAWRDDGPGVEGGARVHFLPHIGHELELADEDAAGTLDTSAIAAGRAEPDPRVDELLVRTELAESRSRHDGDRIDAALHAVELLAIRVDELALRMETRNEPADDTRGADLDVVATLRDLQLAHARLAREQVRVEQLFREDLAALADRVRRLGRPLG